MTTITHRNKNFDFAAVVNLMDDDIREELHDIEFADDQAFFNAYVEAHTAKYGEEFVIN